MLLIQGKRENQLCGECSQAKRKCRCFTENTEHSVARALDEAEAGKERLLTEEEWQQFRILAMGFGSMARKVSKLPVAERTNVACCARPLRNSWI
jgi:hypothetical protein